MRQRLNPVKKIGCAMVSLVVASACGGGGHRSSGGTSASNTRPTVTVSSTMVRLPRVSARIELPSASIVAGPV